jgi:hypothetical protein
MMGGGFWSSSVTLAGPAEIPRFGLLMSEHTRDHVDHYQASVWSTVTESEKRAARRPPKQTAIVFRFH